MLKAVLGPSLIFKKKLPFVYFPPIQLPRMINFMFYLLVSGDPDVQTSQVMESVFMNSGDNPYKLMKNSIKEIKLIIDCFNGNMIICTYISICICI